jgi:hypothetical protein
MSQQRSPSADAAHHIDDVTGVGQLDHGPGRACQDREDQRLLVPADVSSTPLIEGSAERTSRHTWTPLPSYSCTSSTITCGRSLRIRGSASAADPASPATLMSVFVSRSRRPRRTMSWSSKDAHHAGTVSLAVSGCTRRRGPPHPFDLRSMPVIRANGSTYQNKAEGHEQVGTVTSVHSRYAAARCEPSRRPGCAGYGRWGGLRRSPW